MTEAALTGIRAVLYDFDGTLADSTELIMRCYRHTMRTHLGDVPSDDVWLSGFGMTLESQMRRFGRDAGEVEAMLDTYRAYQNTIHDDLLRGAGRVAVLLVVRAVAVAILEVDAEVLDRLALELLVHALPDDVCVDLRQPGRHALRDALDDVGFLLGQHVYAQQSGMLFGQDTGFLIERDPDTVRAPDLAFVASARAS